MSERPEHEALNVLLAEIESCQEDLQRAHAKGEIEWDQFWPARCSLMVARSQVVAAVAVVCSLERLSVQEGTGLALPLRVRGIARPI